MQRGVDMETVFNQKQLKIGLQTGSLANMAMSNNSTIPEVGKGATILLWTDRNAYEVMEVSRDRKRVVIQKYRPKRIDKNGVSEDQEYEYKELSGHDEVIVWRWGAWRKESIDYYCKLVDGVPCHTEKKGYNKICIVWGIKQEYYDFSFVDEFA